MPKITLEFDNVTEARAALDALSVRGDAPVAAPVAAAPVAAPVAAHVAAPDEDLLDSDGMPWCADYHADTKTQNADGTWKARKGCADAAKTARAAFKAAGGNVAPPAETPVAAPTGGLPATPVAAAPAAPAGGLPDAGQMRAPITQAQVEAKIVGMLSRGTLDDNSYRNVLVTSGVDVNDPNGALANNETLRAAVYDACMVIEPGVA